MVLCAGLGTRLRPATSHLPKALFPFLNVPLIDRRLRALTRQGVSEVAVNLHHEGRQIVEHVGETGGSGAAIRWFWEPEILGTAGAVKNAASFFEDEDLAVWNVDAEIDADVSRLAAAHRDGGNAATLLVTDSPDPTRFTPLHAEGSRLVSIGGPGARPLLFTGVSILAPRAVARIPGGHRSLVDDLWRPILAEGRERIGVVFHDGRAFDLGSPRDVLAASIAAIASRRDFDPAEGLFDRETQVLAVDPEVVPDGARRSVFGRARVARSAAVEESVVGDGADLGERAHVARSLVGPLRISPGERVDGMFLWPGDAGVVRVPLHDSSRLYDSSQRGEPAL